MLTGQTAIGSIFSQSFSFAPISTRYIRLEITSNAGDSAITQASEVAFRGTAVPEPTAFAFVLATVVTLVSRRRR